MNLSTKYYVLSNVPYVSIVVKIIITTIDTLENIGYT